MKKTGKQNSFDIFWAFKLNSVSIKANLSETALEYIYTNVKNFSKYRQPCVQWPPLGLKQVGRCSKGGCYWQGIPITYFQFWKIGDQAGHCRQVVVVQRWLLTQVWLHKNEQFISISIAKFKGLLSHRK
jgi:hypothetical protein